MALSETFPKPAARATRSLIPITARELVEWTYAVQRAQGIYEPTLELQGRSQTGIVVDRLIEFAQLGCRVDVSSNAAAIWGEARCDEDAIVVHEIVQAMPVGKRALIILHGLLRSTPEWSPMIMPLRCVPVPGRKGAHKGICGPKSNRQIGTVVTYEGDWPDRDTAVKARAHWPQGAQHLRCAEEVIEYARTLYLDWIMGLMAVEDRLEGHRLRIHGAAIFPKPMNMLLDGWRKSVDRSASGESRSEQVQPSPSHPRSPMPQAKLFRGTQGDLADFSQ